MIDLTLTPELQTQWEAALGAIETLVGGLPNPPPVQKQAIVRAPENSDAWMNNMLVRAQQHPTLLSRTFDLEAVKRDLQLANDLVPLELRLQRAIERLQTARFLCRSDAFAELLGVRRALRDAGLQGIDDDLNEGLQRFFKRTQRPGEPTPTVPSNPTPEKSGT